MDCTRCYTRIFHLDVSGRLLASLILRVVPCLGAIEGPMTCDPLHRGMSLMRSVKQEAAARIEMARAVRPFLDVSDLARHAQLDRRNLEMLAAANTVHSLAGGRRSAGS